MQSNRHGNTTEIALRLRFVANDLVEKLCAKKEEEIVSFVMRETMKEKRAVESRIGKATIAFMDKIGARVHYDHVTISFKAASMRQEWIKKREVIRRVIDGKIAQVALNGITDVKRYERRKVDEIKRLLA